MHCLRNNRYYFPFGKSRDFQTAKNGMKNGICDIFKKYQYYISGRNLGFSWGLRLNNPTNLLIINTGIKNLRRNTPEFLGLRPDYDRRDGISILLQEMKI